MKKLFYSIQDLGIRLSRDGKALGSGFLASHPSDSDFVYVVTALHCLEGLASGSEISIDKFDYEIGCLKSHIIKQQEYQVLSFGKSISELCLIRVSKQWLPLEIPQLTIRMNPSSGRSYRFRGFPGGSLNIEPIEIQVSGVLKLGITFSGKTDEHLEDNLTIASSNVKALSGSGLFQVVDETIEICGIITHFKQFNRFTICSFAVFNDLLERANLPRWEILPALVDIIEFEGTTSASYYELSSKFFENAELLIENLKPSQANNILETALSQIKKDPISEQDRKALLARLYIFKVWQK